MFWRIADETLLDRLLPAYYHNPENINRIIDRLQQLRQNFNLTQYQAQSILNLYFNVLFHNAPLYFNSAGNDNIREIEDLQRFLTTLNNTNANH